MTKTSSRPLKGIHVLSLALNLPGPAALMRLQAMGAQCQKLEPPARPNVTAGITGDPMSQYNATAYATLHQNIKVFSVDLKTGKGQVALHKKLAKTDVLLTSFRPSALEKLGLSWKSLHRQYPALSLIAIVGAPGARAEEPGHDLTYLAEAGLVTSLDLPATLFADMTGAITASESVLKAVLTQKITGKACYESVALSDAATWLALPRTWGLTQRNGPVGGAHAGYQLYACKDARVAVAALEPHFATALLHAAGFKKPETQSLVSAKTHATLAAFFKSQTRQQLDRLASEKDIPMMTLPNC